MIDTSYIKEKTDQTGIYLFYRAEEPIYIGKAMNIRARLLSHLRNSEYDTKEQAIIEQSDSIKTILTRSEFNALLLEAQLIKKYKPFYNSIWKDDKQYVYIKIAKSAEYPYVQLVRKENIRGNLYFGPFSSKKVAMRLLRDIRKMIPFSMHEKIGSRSCFYHKIGLCNPCPSNIEKQKDPEKKESIKQFKQNITLLTQLLKGNVTRLELSYEKNIRKASEKDDFEKALVWRNKLYVLRKFVYSARFGNDINEVDKDRNVVLPDTSVLREYFPNISEKLFRIECFDISTFQGDDSVGSMVVFENGFPSPSEYKRFKIKQAFRRSDIHMLEEVITRRLKHSEWPYPDLLVVDGGKPQVRAIHQVMKKLSVSIPLIGIAKGIDRIIIGKEPYKTVYLKESNPFFLTLKYLRDESHRFAKKYHLLLRDNVRSSM